MSFEVVYTSAPRGLQEGSSGFCTVASTKGIPRALLKKLESLSGYHHISPAGSGSNPSELLSLHGPRSEQGLSRAVPDRGRRTGSHWSLKQDCPSSGDPTGHCEGDAWRAAFVVC